MSTKSTGSASWVVALKSIGVFVLALLALLGLVVLISASGSVWPVVPVAGLALLIGAVWAGFIRLLRRPRAGRPPYWQSWLRASGVWGLVLLAVLALPLLVATFINTVEPLAVPRVTLSNGEKEVVFQGMIHIGSAPYYQGVVFDLSKAADLDYVLLFEGVRSGSEENTAAMNRILGTQGLNLNQIYDAFAEQCGLHFQNEFFGVFYDDIVDDPDQFINADVSVDDMMAEWERLLEEHPEWRAQQVDARPETEVDNQLDGLMDRLNGLTPGQRRLTELACHVYLNVNFSRLGAEKPPFKEHVVVDFRNRHLADTILAQPAGKVYVTYGYDHFRGVFKLLTEADPRWKIVDVEWRQAIAGQVELERELYLEE